MGLTSRVQHRLALLAVIVGAGALGVSLTGLGEVDRDLAAAAAPTTDVQRVVYEEPCPRRGEGRF